MNWKTQLPRGAGFAALLVALNIGGLIAPAAAEDVVLTMAVPDWPPTRIMKDLFDKNYKAPSGNTVKLDIDFIPWPDYYTRLNTSLTSGENKYTMAVSDSQWLGAFIEAGYYRKINDLIVDNSGAVKNVIIGVGGFLGVGERYIAVSFNKLKWVDEPIRTANTAPPAAGGMDSGRTVGSTANTPSSTSAPSPSSTAATARVDAWYPDHAVLSATKDDVKAMPEFKY